LIKNKVIKSYALIVVFLGISIVFYSGSGVNLPNFLIFLLSGILIGINIIKIKNVNKDTK